MQRTIGLAVALVLACGGDGDAKPSPNRDLRVVIVRHGEKPDNGDQLSCRGMNRALKLPAVIEKLGKPDFAYVPSLKLGEQTKHARMFQTITPVAIKWNLAVNTAFDEKDAKGVAADVQKRKGTVLLVWEHSAIPDVAHKLGIASPPAWKGHDFDSVWIITYDDAGAASLAVDREGITPADACAF